MNLGMAASGISQPHSSAAIGKKTTLNKSKLKNAESKPEGQFRKLASDVTQERVKQVNK